MRKKINEKKNGPAEGALAKMKETQNKEHALPSII